MMARPQEPSGGSLDDPAAIARVDRSGMLLAIAGLPAQVRDAWARSSALELPGRHAQARSVAVLGAGASAIAGELVGAVWADRLKVPLVVVRTPELPAWVGPDTLVVASSHSGSTDDTLRAVEAAFTRRCPVAVVTGGGPLGKVAAAASLPLLAHPTGGQGRAALGWSMVSLARLLQRAGLLEVDDVEVEAAAAEGEAGLAAWGPGVPSESNVAKQLAWAMLDRLPVITGSGHLAVVARRWKTALNENARSMAVWDELTDATHSSVAGYPGPETTTDHLLHLFLASAADADGTQIRTEVAGELLDEAGVSSQVVRVPGEGRLASAVAGVILGDLVSAYLAVLYGKDPTPVDAIARVKSALATPDPGDDATDDADSDAS